METSAGRLPDKVSSALGYYVFNAIAGLFLAKPFVSLIARMKAIFKRVLAKTMKLKPVSAEPSP